MRAIGIPTLVAILATACSGNSRLREDGQPPSPSCDAMRPRVESLYRAQLAAGTGDVPAELGAGQTSGQLSGQISGQLSGQISGRISGRTPGQLSGHIGDDVDMVLTDCARDPARLVPCIQSAASASQLERDCLVPIDDQGTEGRVFRVQ